MNYVFSITDFQPREGSLEGGTQITLTGTGFSGLADRLTLNFCGDIVCSDVVVHSDTSASCTVQTAGTTHNVRNSGTHPSKCVCNFKTCNSEDHLPNETKSNFFLS